MTQKKPNLAEAAQQLVSLRLGETPYTKIKKKDLWGLLHTLMDSPVLGLIDKGDEDSYNEELKRIYRVFLSPDGVKPDTAISVIGGGLNYDTLLVLNRSIQHYLSVIAEAYDMMNTRPGEIDQLSDLMAAANKRISKGSDMVKEAPVEVSFQLLVSLLNLIARMGSDAEFIMNLLPREQ